MNCARSKFRLARFGGTLMEMLVVIALTAVLLGSAVSMIVSLMAYRSGSNQRVLEISEQNRLTDVLRRDLRQAKSVSIDSESVLSIIDEQNEPVRYSLTGAACRRDCTQAEGTQRRFEQYQIGDYSAWEIVELSDGNESLLEVDIKPGSKESVGPVSPTLRIVAERQNTP